MALIHIYCGDGKGKTTAAVGLAVRAAGAGYHVIFAQFLKSRETSEIESLHKIPGIQVVRGEIDFPFTWELSEEEIRELREVQNAILSHMTHVKYDGDVMIVLDEVIGAYNHDFLDRNALLEQIKNLPENVELVMTGTDPPPELCERAHYISEIKKIRHPYDSGIAARRGIEE